MRPSDSDTKTPDSETHGGTDDQPYASSRRARDGEDAEADHFLLIEDVGSLRAIYDAYLRNAGFVTHLAASAEEGMRIFRENPIRMVLLDLMLPDRDGDELIAEMLALRPYTAIIAVTADRSIDRAVRAMQEGAIDFLVKPIDEPRFRSAIESARSLSLRADANDANAVEGTVGEFIGSAPKMRALYARTRAAARSTAPVYIWGESGTGKELCAHAVHSTSPRADGPFIALDCGALPAERIDSELFGHSRGAFPGALEDKPGALHDADGGTLLLDNIGELAPTAQIKLLRFLQSGQIKPLGASQAIDVNVRIVCAATSSPTALLQSGAIREDLYYRLVVLAIEMPPLRMHRQDIGPLARMALERFASEEDRCFSEIEPEAIARLEDRPWPGNVRELMNVIRATIVMHEGPVLRAHMLPEFDPTMAAAAAPAAQAADPFANRTLAEIERAAIEAAIDRHDGSIPRAALELGVAPSTIYRKRDAWLSKD
ncbi:sigma-54-dependent transcriptional regulator [Thioclava nitratireducens]|uniref:sigma-54-dependent transcriptional regulator n=1 Tax=Thioclava nitratireducens TaxID=1915078 RepID=UPI0024805120|nr:sigma-54 dependent transcriptional regulator [Thioclava nitratireducens]WGT48991.1 sigma-54 dependent transcriptional regulator [Thioclava nitratireducens]